MKHGLKLAGMIAAIAMHLPAHADEKLDVLKKVNIDGCMSVIQIDEDAPKDPKLAKPYCTCVYETHFNNFTKPELNSMFLGTPAPPNMDKNVQIRLQAAIKECRKKIGA